MKILLLILFLFIANCKLNKVVENHGIHFLDKKQQNLVVNKTNKNDIIKILGPPSTKSQFNNDLWIYIEAQQKGQTLLKFGNKKLYTNNVLQVSSPKISFVALTKPFNTAAKLPEGISIDPDSLSAPDASTSKHCTLRIPLTNVTLPKPSTNIIFLLIFYF